MEFVAVDQDVRLEVLDWGGTGRPLVLLAGGGLTERQEKAVENGVPTTHVVTLPGAHHYVFLTNAADVMREMRAFLTGLR